MDVEYHLVMNSVTGREVARLVLAQYPAEYYIKSMFKEYPLAASATVEKHFIRSVYYVRFTRRIHERRICSI